MGSECQSYHNLHFVVVPFLCPGHLIPMVDIARLLAQHGAVVTIVTTPINAMRITPMVDLANESSNSQIRVLQIKVPSAEFGLPEGCESLELIPARELLGNFFKSISMMQEPIEDLIEDLKPSPACLVADKIHYWMDGVATKFNIPRITFDGTGCLNHLLFHNLLKSKVHENAAESEPFLVPNMPHKMELTRARIPMDLKPETQEYKDFRVEKILASQESAYGVVINSFEELEPDCVRAYQNAKQGTKVWCIGPVSMSYKGSNDVVQRGNKAKIDQDFCIKWLDSKPEKSVVYVCLGTLNCLSLAQFQELALALEDSNCPFIWVMKDDPSTKVAKNWLLESGFEDRNKENGLIIHGWAPQVLIFSHKSMGVFLTHCGWNSTLEAICAGVPMITWPMFADQFINEKLIVEILKVGEALGSEVTIAVGEQDMYGAMIKRGQIVNAIYKVIGDGIEKEERRERVRDFSDLAKKTMEPKGSSYLNMEMLLEDISKLALDKLTQ